MQRRLVVILTFPLIIIFFLIGWVLYCIGGKQPSLKKETERKSNAVKNKAESFSEEEIEIGLIEEVREEIST